MKLDYVPLLQTQRDLYQIPRGMDRFRQYLRTIFNDDRTGLELPSLGIANPMAKEHVAALLDSVLALDADAVAGQAVAEASPQVADEAGEFKVGLVVVDDLKGGWTNRYDYEFTLRFPQGSSSSAKAAPPKWLTHRWLTAVLWSSEPPTTSAVREAILTTVYRAAYIQRHGTARTLRDMMTQEGHVMARAGCIRPSLDPDDLEYTREVLIPFLDATDKRTAIECLFGDEAGKTLGFTPRGLSHWAGLALALHNRRA